MAIVLLHDDAKSFSANAAGNISGGGWLTAGSYTNTVTSQDASLWSPSKVLATGTGSGLGCIGMALYDVTSGTNNIVAVLREGTVIVPANGTVDAGEAVCAASAGGDGSVGPVAAGREHGMIGRALVTATSGGFTIVNFKI